MDATVPERFGWAVGALPIKRSDQILEIGCGRGIAVGLIAPRLSGGRILAVDRSATAIAAARKRNTQWAALDRARFLTAALADLPAAVGPFDKIFAINVNLFWTDPRAELPVVRNLLKKRGRLYLFFEPPAAAQRQRIARLVAEKFSGSGLRVEEVLSREEGAPFIGLICGASADG